ncbi:MAG: AAA family ATPase [Candidatus Taylorbacteria bacterium RIFCSPLOWO2_01_FULL_45_15b]|uniref:AAA family ATPase n=1 Tax=Candidatus Taylorbacteria bacterium RIFCSPLOWO2_01_FULL_45_15b TaxID=1802319 RepID=A0A1G2NDI9_9BACT|nr:MAG: AAA family ATPase [Candidatus Taylorbacteria bacterium RIFCSPLOWO2_01_FULL_45_15b]
MTQEIALAILKTGANIFLTGEPGSGKSHTVNEYVSYLRSHDIEPSITASTGIAATHVGGMTIHSWSGIGIKKLLTAYDIDKITSLEYIVKRIRATHVLIIDEVSMLLPGMLDMVDAVCRAVKKSPKPFGGLQVIFVGDFFQLPPVVRRDTGDLDHTEDLLFEQSKGIFAYESRAWRGANPLVCYLTEQHRQDDDEYLRILSSIRSNSFDDEHLEHFEKRKVERANMPKKVPKLYSHNVDVDRVNHEELIKLQTEKKQFSMEGEGRPALVAALKKGCLSPEDLLLSVGASIMFTKNNPKEGYVNGTLGEVLRFEQSSGLPVVKTKENRYITVSPMEWSIEENGKVRASIRQLPLRLAWAITVHKSQGMSMDEAIMDLSQVFEYGQGYVALSRVRRLSGLYILGWNRRAFEVHPRILEEDVRFKNASEETADAFSGQSPDELQKMHANFIRFCGGTIEKNAKGARGKRRRDKKGDTNSITLELLKSKKNIKEIAEERSLALNTIIDHLEHLKKAKALDDEDLAHLRMFSVDSDFSKIKEAYRALGAEKVKPIFEFFKGKYSYEKLRLARLFIV